ncbi:alpha-ketoacid dehydrogenase subunit beta [Magnetospira sp. QH-2]|uniref:alpha-ketoacid dehydrogenase subunit beta n=1 Tax=Magnetospira sp. (strain QH-2) TaxID=1288970 RepID=UPI0003E81BCF|nr:transketolase C-terminal domain-containing protein [Magnetospira sp. QH-2]CCQ73058.1 Pyruvate dehydrogenase E1 component subunit beta [Magnetospira sp. QH-2]
MREITYGQAIREATAQAMQADPNVFVLGLGVDDPKGIFGTTLDLHKDFGADRCFDTPLAEDGMTGVAIGAAMAGMRPVHVHQRMDFLLLCMNQLVNIAAKTHYVFAGEVSVPLVVRCVIGRSWGQGAQHSQALHSLFMHVPGLKVLAPTTPHDAKGMLIAAIQDNNPVIFVEHRMLHYHSGLVPEESFAGDMGKARVLAKGKDVTIVAISHMAVEAARARQILAQKGIEAELIDPVSLSPLDMETILRSVRKTGRLLVVDVAWPLCGAASEIIAQVAEGLQYETPPQLARLTTAAVPCPTTKPLENAFYPDLNRIAAKAYEMVAGVPIEGLDGEPENWDIAEFRGPF